MRLLCFTPEAEAVLRTASNFWILRQGMEDKLTGKRFYNTKIRANGDANLRRNNPGLAWGQWRKGFWLDFLSGPPDHDLRL